MRNILTRGMTSLATVGALVALGTPVASAADQEVQQTVKVVGTGSSVHLSRSWVYAGSIRFKVSTTNGNDANGNGGSSITLFRVKRGHTLAQVLAGFKEEFNPKTGAKGTRDLRRAAVFRGLADIQGTAETVTEYLGAGTYYTMDLSGPPPASGYPALTKLRVLPTKPRIEQDSDLVSDVHVTANHDRFHAPRMWPHQGTYTFTNHDDTPHFMSTIPLKAGTTRAEVLKALNSTGNQSGPPPFFRPGPSWGNDVVSPGHTLQVTYNVPKGTYALVCFVADEETGMPHALMGMVKIVVVT